LEQSSPGRRFEVKTRVACLPHSNQGQAEHLSKTLQCHAHRELPLVVLLESRKAPCSAKRPLRKHKCGLNSCPMPCAVSGNVELPYHKRLLVGADFEGLRPVWPSALRQSGILLLKLTDPSTFHGWPGLNSEMLFTAQSSLSPRRHAASAFSGLE